MTDPRFPYFLGRHADPAPDAPALATDGLSVRYPGTRRLALRGVSLRAPRGARVALVGANGAGKSTLLKAVAGLWNLALGGLAAAAVTAVAIAWVSRRQRVKEDTAIGVVFTGMFAAGVLLMSRTSSYRDLLHMLFGNVLGVTTDDLTLIASVAAVVLVTLALFHKELELTSFDPTHAEVIGLRAGLMRLLLLGLLALAVVTGIQAVGVILTNALLVTPAAAAGPLTDKFPRRMLIAAGLATACAVAGLVTSYLLQASSGASVVLACTAAFALAGLVGAAGRRLRPNNPSD